MSDTQTTIGIINLSTDFEGVNPGPKRHDLSERFQSILAPFVSNKTGTSTLFSKLSSEFKLRILVAGLLSVTAANVNAQSNYLKWELEGLWWGAAVFDCSNPPENFFKLGEEGRVISWAPQRVNAGQTVSTTFCVSDQVIINDGPYDSGQTLNLGDGLQAKLTQEPIFKYRDFGYTYNVVKWELFYTPPTNDPVILYKRVVATNGPQFMARSSRDSANIRITSLDNLPPQFDDQTFHLEAGRYFYTQLSASDDSFGSIVFSAEQSLLPTGLQVSSNGSVTWSPKVDQVGLFRFPVTATDSHEPPSSKTASITLLVGEYVNQPPIISGGGAFSAEEGEILSIPLTIHDPDGDELEIYAIGAEETMTFESTNLIWQVPFDSSGNYLVTITANDGVAQTSTDILISVSQTTSLSRACIDLSGALASATITKASRNSYLAHSSKACDWLSEGKTISGRNQLKALENKVQSDLLDQYPGNQSLVSILNRINDIKRILEL